MRSHASEELIAAQNRGEEIWQLETSNTGEDDYLIGTREEVLADICCHFELDELPDEWELIRVDWQL